MRIIITFTCFLIGYVSVFAQTLVCPAGLTNAGTELITNGNFSSGNSSFSSDYVNNQASTWNEGTYAII